METLAFPLDMDVHLDILAQQPLLNIYTQITLCFPLPNDKSHAVIADTLTTGLERLAAKFPWLAGQVVNEDAGEGNTGVFKIKPLNRIPPLVVKDLRHDPSIMPTMDVLRRAGYPSGMLDEAIIAPRRTIPGHPDEAGLDFVPVFLMQANILTGGLLLTFAAHHATMDMTGQGQIMHLFSKACCGEEFTSGEVTSGNLDRRNVVPLLDDSYVPGSELDRQLIKSTPSDALPPVAGPKCTWAHFSFDPASLKALKLLGTQTISSQASYISTDDALSAFIWQSVVRARLPRLGLTASSTFGRAVDVRRYLEVPQSYPGLLQNMTYHASSLQKLVEQPLGAVASELRSALDIETTSELCSLRYHTRAVATFLSRTLDKSVVSFAATINPSTDMMLSSWAKVNCYELDFGLGLGKPEAVRRPTFMPFEGLLYLMPKSLDGGIALAICLRDEDMERLKGDREFAKYAQYIG